MYLWKCWRDTRYPFLVFVSALLAVGAYCAYLKFDPFGWIAAKPLELRFVLQGLGPVLLDMLLSLVPFAGLFLGALGVGTEFEKRTADFLLTRPRTRGYFLLTSWGLGAAQMVVLVLVCNLFRLAGLGSDRVEGPGDFFRPVVGLCTLALVCYSLTYLMTTLARNSRNGTALALAVGSGYAGLAAWLHLWYEINIPIFADLWERPFQFGADFPLTVAGLLTVCLAFVLAAQFSFECAEV